MWRKQCHKLKLPLTGNGKFITPIYGDDCGKVYYWKHIVVKTLINTTNDLWMPIVMVILG